MRDIMLASALVLGVCCTTCGRVDAQGTAEQREACTPDALRLCAATIPDVARTTECMKAHRAELSSRCKAAFADEPRRDAAAPSRTAAHSAATHRVERQAVDRRAALTEPPYGRDPDAEVLYTPPRRVIAPPLYSNPGPPLNPGGVPYDDLFAGPSIFALPGPYGD